MAAVNVPLGFEKFTVSNMLNTSSLNSTLLRAPVENCFAKKKSI